MFIQRTCVCLHMYDCCNAWPVNSYLYKSAPHINYMKLEHYECFRRSCSLILLQDSAFLCFYAEVVCFVAKLALVDRLRSCILMLLLCLGL
jgi:hypothetical protein